MQRLFSGFIGNKGATGLLVLRVVAGLALMFHGWPKIQNPFNWMGSDSWAPGFLQGLAALCEFGGGFLLILGLLTPLACFGIACVMATAILSVHLPKGDPFVALPGTGRGSYELALNYFAVAVALMLAGPGIFSLDAWLFRKKAAATQAPIAEPRPRVPV
ncbi:MAG TPA: DoxX family protein [Candidatus Obscuribacterales bacterium]